MKVLSTLAIVLTLAGCGQKQHEQDQNHGHDHAHDAPVSEANQALYDEVMKVHDEVMPKMNDLYKIKKGLQQKLEETKDLSEEKKKELETAISKVDSASESMMVWMRQFNPLPDSLGEERAREYLEDEMQKVKKVKEDILEALSNSNP